MADGRDLQVWDHHAQECREQDRKPFEFDFDTNLEEEGEVEYPKVAKKKTNWMHEKLSNLSDVNLVLDIGCGPGYWVNMFTGFTYVGFDQSPGMLRLARELSPDREFVQGNGRNLTASFPDRKFDLIFTSAVLQHNRHEPDKKEIVLGMRDILRDGGYYLCTENTFREDNCPASVGNPAYTDGYSFTPDGWREWMEPFGFKLLEYHGPSEYLFQKI